jgi:short-subunit dehydrogenase|tara:strand:- start:566 stop:1273 length:708 start_codon:yes stop_codon:yes gene_type:complete
MKNKICLITGASKGIGRSIVQRLLESGAIVCATSSNSQNLSNLKNDFDQYKENLHTFIADLTSTSDVNNLCESVSKKIGDIDILINNAGVLHLESLENSSDELLRKSFEVNFFAPFALTRFFSKSMVEKKQGCIINICSSSSYTGGGAPEHCIYASTKHALLGFSRALDEELRSSNIRVGTISPAGVSTDMMGDRADLDHTSFMTADEVAAGVMFLLNSDGQGIVYEMRMWRKNR